jgi:hypothetical protein
VEREPESSTGHADADEGHQSHHDLHVEGQAGGGAAGVARVIAELQLLQCGSGCGLPRWPATGTSLFRGGLGGCTGPVSGRCSLSWVAPRSCAAAAGNDTDTGSSPGRGPSLSIRNGRLEVSCSPAGRLWARRTAGQWRRGRLRGSVAAG